MCVCVRCGSALNVHCVLFNVTGVGCKDIISRQTGGGN